MSGSDTSSSAASEFVAAELERLLSLPLATAADVDRWYDEAGLLQEALEQRYPFFPIPHELWHYFSDADIRAKEPGYRQRQESFVSAYVAQLRSHSNVG